MEPNQNLNVTPPQNGSNDAKSSKVLSSKNNMIIIALIIIVIAGGGYYLFSRIIPATLNGLNSAKNDARDAEVKAKTTVMLTDAMMANLDSSTFEGYKPDGRIIFPVCSGSPIMNISPDGKQIAFFGKSCADTTKYYCADNTVLPSAEGNMVTEEYAKSGAFFCKVGEVSGSTGTTATNGTSDSSSSGSPAKDITFTLPSGFTEDADRSDNSVGVTYYVRHAGHVIITVSVSPNNDSYSASPDSDIASNWPLSDGNYSIGGENAQVYESKQNNPLVTRTIFVPSKLVQISTFSPSYAKGTTQTQIDSILASIKFQ